jgi:hypothetical protein
VLLLDLRDLEWRHAGDLGSDLGGLGLVQLEDDDVPFHNALLIPAVPGGRKAD